MRLLVFCLIAAGAAAAATAPAAPVAAPDVAMLLREHSHVFAYSDQELTGEGAAFLRKATGNSQFVLLGEQHQDREIPRFAGALFHMLHAAHAVRTLVVEQDPVAIEDALDHDRRGDVDALARHARRYPSLYEFNSDQDLALLADVARSVRGDNAIWGVEQAVGAVRYLEALRDLATSDRLRQRIDDLLAAARAADPGPEYTAYWLANIKTGDTIASLTDAFAAKPGTRAAELLARLAKSAEIFGYYTRAESGEFVGLYNNTVRESELKSNFLRRYRAASVGGHAPRALFKFGANHLYRGRNPTQAFPIGNLAHELAIFNGMEAYGLLVIALGPDYAGYADMPEWMRVLLPAAEPGTPQLVDLRALRRFQRLFREKVAPADAWQMLNVLHGYDAIVLLPGSGPATRKLGVVASAQQSCEPECAGPQGETQCCSRSSTPTPR